jgi:hypothetical protein
MAMVWSRHVHFWVGHGLSGHGLSWPWALQSIYCAGHGPLAGWGGLVLGWPQAWLAICFNGHEQGIALASWPWSWMAIGWSGH